MTDIIVEFIRARLDDDERYARVMQATGQRLKDNPSPGMDAFAVSTLTAMLGDADAMREMAHWTDDNMPPNDLGRILGDIAAKRAILDLYDMFTHPTGLRERVAWPPAAEAILAALRSIAAIWDKHPEFREEWTP